ncbi:MAG: phage major capsid protein [Maritimibacter sp.]|mgnify:CR=1 FL=1|nr:phage major capsid protein [Maritimibacter sp.]
MSKKAALQKRLAELQAEGTKILDAAESAERGLTAEEESRFEAIEDEIKAVQSDIKEAEKMEARKRILGGLAAGTTLSPAGGTTVRDLNPETTAGFADLGEFAVAVHAAVHGGDRDERLVALANSHEGGTTSGEGYMLPPAHRDEIWELVNQFDEFGPMIDEEPTANRSVKLLADESTPWGATGIESYWRAEGSQMTASKLAGQERNVPLHELYTLALASEELLEDAPRLNARLSRKAAEAIAWKKNLAIVEGTGVGQPLGWFNSPAMVTVAKESGQSADTLATENIVNMYSRLLMVPGSQPFWLGNSDILPQLMTLTLGDKPVWLPPNGLAGAPNGFILGLPLRLSEYAKTLGDLGDLQLIQPRGYYGARRASGVKYATSIHLYFDYNTQAFRWVFRYGGQPHLSAPVSPHNGTATKSHFVALAERA